ncbi:MAG: ABC transporter permease [Motiliproteus sp.]
MFIITDPTFLFTCLVLSTPLVFASLGGILAERAGVYNIGLEGMMMAGAFGSAVGAYLTGSAIGGLIGGVMFAATGGFILAVLAVSLGINQMVAGIAINMFFIGLTAFLARLVFGMDATTMTLPGFSPVEIPLLSDLPVLGKALFSHDPLTYLMLLCVPLVYWILFRTHWGLNIRSVGENPRAADTAGVSVTRVRYLCVVFSGVLAGLGGCYLVLSQVFVFTEHMTAGKGFIALAALILGRWNPVGALLACLFFGFADALQLRLQFSNPDVPYQLFVMLPYVASIVALVGFAGKVKPPAAIGLHFVRGGK